MPNYSFHHTHLISPDPNKTAEFYIKNFGAQKADPISAPSGPSARLILNGSRLLIGAPRTEPARYGLDHFGIATDDIEATVKELKAGGAKFQTEITQLRPGAKIAFFYAPDNVLIELVEEKSA